MTNTTQKFISIEQAIKAGNDGQNQDIKGQFVAKHVYCNVNSLAEYVLNKGFEDSNAPFTLDDIENYYEVNTEKIIDLAIGDWSEKQEEFKAYSNDQSTFNRKVKSKSDFQVFLHSLDETEFDEFCTEFDYEDEMNDREPKEIYEWWAVSGYLFDKLNENGCCVVDAGSCKLWGRTTTGQAILLDGIITRICAEMQILDGQENSWAK